MNFSFWLPGISKVYQISILVCLISLTYFVGDAVRLHPRVDFEMMGLDRGTFSLDVEEGLYAAGFDKVRVWPTTDWRGMDVTIKFFEYSQPYEELNDNRLILGLLKAFALEGFRYSRKLCEKAETEYPLALIEEINVHYYLSHIEVNQEDTVAELVKEDLLLSESTSCKRVAGMSIWEYAALPWSQKTRYFIWAFN